MKRKEKAQSSISNRRNPINKQHMFNERLNQISTLTNQILTSLMKLTVLAVFNVCCSNFAEFRKMGFAGREATFFHWVCDTRNSDLIN